MAEIRIDDLNIPARANPEAMIAGAEQAYRDHVDSIADQVVANKNIKVILLAGPSGSGKTTTANLISDAIKARGEESMVVSLDDFYRDAIDPSYPRNADGERDYECPESLHLEFLAETLNRIASGEPFILPKYDFKVSARVEERPHPAIGNGCVIIEGLHALNPRIADVIPHEKRLKLFVSVSTNINKDGIRIISGRKMRFVRRMVRDSIYRGADAERTLALWRGVLAAEDIYLYPYKPTADIAFDTFHAFEPGVMRRFALPLISQELAKREPYAMTVLVALGLAEPIDSDLVPEDSLIREFIAGGIYDEIY